MIGTFASRRLTDEDVFARAARGDAAAFSEVYRRYVTGMKIGLNEVGAHYAISSIFRAYPEDGEIFCFDVHRESHEVFNSGRGSWTCEPQRESAVSRRGQREGRQVSGRLSRYAA